MSIKLNVGLATLGLGCILAGSTVQAATPQDEFIKLRDTYVAQLAPLEKEAGNAWWDSATTGNDEAYARREKADNALAKLYQDKATFAKLKELREAKVITDPVLKCELDVMYRSYIPYQANPELSRKIIALEAEVDKIFNTHRSDVNGKKLTENDVRKVLSTTKNADEARQAWEGYMAVGQKVAPPLKELVKLRNEVARELGYRDYFTMQLDIQEFSEAEILTIFDDLDKLTIKPFTELKAKIDKHMIERFDVKDGVVRPWLLGDLFFQEAPELTSFSTDSLYAGKDPVKLSTAYYQSMGLDPTAIIGRSDLYERPGKSPHAFENCMDRNQDIRVLCNVKPNAAWMDTVNHELGHGVYDQYISPKVPFLLRTPSHILTTEGMAMLDGEFTRTHEFLEKVVQVPADQLEEASAASWSILRSERLLFCRWTLTMLHFEREMYANPDQDLNKLWWSLKKKYQHQDPPADLSGQDYGAKMHIVGAPVYYHNYMLGDLFASQLYSHIAKHELGIANPLTTCFYGRPEAGEYLKTHVYAPGNLYDWRELTIRATGEPLSAKAFAELFVH